MSSRNRLDICVATMTPAPASGIDLNAAVHLMGGPPNPGEIGSFCDHASNGMHVHVKYNTPEANDGVIGSYQKLCDETSSELLAFIHDDVICREDNWDTRVNEAFEDPEVGLVGFGGARAHGHPDLYKVPYELRDLQRYEYASNVDDAEVHGERFTGERDVSVLDGFALVVRRDLLDRAGGWSRLARGCDFFCYDYALSAVCRRLGYRIRLVGVRCHHLGGRTSVLQPSVKEITSQDAFDKSHRWFYETYRDVMPWRVQ